MAQTQSAKDSQDGRVHTKSIAVWPPIYLKGDDRSDNKTAIEKVEEVVQASFDKAGVSIIPSAKVHAAINQAAFTTDKGSDSLPTPDELEQVGRACDADYVLTYRCRRTTRSIFQITGLHTKAYCKATVEILSVRDGKVIYSPDPVAADSQQAPNGLLIITSLFVWTPAAFVSGGPETGPMCRAGELAMAEALNDWVKDKVTAAQSNGRP
jgi:hypothetical protein